MILIQKRQQQLKDHVKAFYRFFPLKKRENGFAKMSGTYVTYDDRFYVITAAHGIVGDCEYFFVATNSDNIYDCIQYIIVDQLIDYAIIEIEEVPDRTAR